MLRLQVGLPKFKSLFFKFHYMKGYLLSMLFVLGLLLPGIASAQTRTITGRVMDESGSPLSGASIQAQGRGNVGTTTDANGQFSLTLSSSTTAVVASYVGMGDQRVALSSDRSAYDITLFSESLNVGEVVIQAGILTREAATFTGSVKQVTQAELKEAGTLNALSALSTLDPSFNIVVDNLMGSNPNALPNIEINGKTSLDVTGVTDEYSVNPNLPLFVIDGFESTLEKVNDMDINRIASITILKDAGSTAIYGAKGANGVVVVETVKPKPGELMINYNLNATVSFADLSAYNLMNSEEKLLFEALSGYYDIGDPSDPNYLRYDNPLNVSSYWHKFEQVQKGIDTYWLKYPVRTGISHQHHLSVSGGEDKLFYQASVGYNNKVGVMKGSNHETVNGNIFLQYRAGRLNVSNDMGFGSTNTHNGSYGKFQTWADMSPYFKPYDDDGILTPNVNTYGDFVANPLYNAHLYTDNTGKAIEFVNNTKLDYMVQEIGLRIYGGLSLKRTSASVADYRDPRNTDYRDVDYTRRGSYTQGSSDEWEWSGNIAASITRTFADVHNFTLLARAQADNNNSWRSSFTAIGFPEGTKPNPSQAFQYAPGSHPTYSTGVRRGVAFLLSLNYNYAAKYLFDVNVNRDGSTTFGKNNPYTTNWSVGLGWNVFNEDFAKDWTWANNMKIRGSIGTNANQNMNMLSSSIYNFESGIDYFGPAWTMSNFANPNLNWQKTRKISVGVDLAMLDNRLNFTFDVFDNRTDPLAINLPQPPSTGVNGYDVNMGHIDSRGWNTSASYVFIRRPEDRMLFSGRLSAGHSKQVYGGFENAFNRLNEEMANSLGIETTLDDNSGNPDEDALAQIAENLKNNTSLKKYEDGSDPDALWAVKSLGIDPATGREVFQSKDGAPVFIYNAEDRVVIASTRAKVQGSIGFTFNYKHLRSSLNFKYALGGYAFNRALYDRVENILGGKILNNQDKRALYDRWQKPGDVSEFKSIQLYSEANPISSRFIQRNNYLEATAIQAGWDFYDSKFVEKLGLRSLVFNVSTNNLFRISTIKQERGFDYPFAREVIFSLSASF